MVVPLIGFTCTSCCSNVVSFESLIRLEPKSSTFIVFAQYVFITVASYLLLLLENRFKGPLQILLKPASIPYYRYLISTAGFLAAGVLGNLVFRYRLSLPVHIIFRSSSTAFTMVLGYLFFEKTYTWGQIIGSTIMSIGIVLVTLSNMSQSQQWGSLDDFLKGMTILISVTLLTSFTSLYNESSNRIYRRKGSGGWEENLFYSYLYALPFFLLIPGTLTSEFALVQELGDSYWNYWIYLFINCATQLLCVSGVNGLVVTTSAVTLGVILHMRRFLSLLLSMAIFKNTMNLLGAFGSLLVFLGGAQYAYTVGKLKEEPASKSQSIKKSEKAKAE